MLVAKEGAQPLRLQPSPAKVATEEGGARNEAPTMV